MMSKSNTPKIIPVFESEYLAVFNFGGYTILGDTAEFLQGLKSAVCSHDDFRGIKGVQHTATIEENITVGTPDDFIIIHLDHYIGADGTDMAVYGYRALPFSHIHDKNPFVHHPHH